MSTDLLRQKKYTFVSFVTMVTRAAIRGGMPQEAAFSLSDSYCQQMDRLMGPADVDALSYKMAMDFCGRVGQLHGAEALSLPLRRCLDYIGQNLHRPNRTEDLAAYCGVSVRTLSACFQRELGVSVPAYVQGERLREAAYLLTASEFSLAEISAICNSAPRAISPGCSVSGSAARPTSTGGRAGRPPDPFPAALPPAPPRSPSAFRRSNRNPPFPHDNRCLRGKRGVGGAGADAP